MPSLVPPEDESIRTLYVGGLDPRISEQDLKDNFYAFGEIESIRLVLQRACAFVTYTTREGAEKAAEELSNKLVIKGVRLKLMWGKPQAPKPESESQDDEAAKQGVVAHGGMLPRSVVSQQHQLQPPGIQDHVPLPYFNIPAPLPPERTFYPSMDPQRMGALVSSQEASSSTSGSAGQDKQKQLHSPQQGTFRPPDGSHYPYQAPLPQHGPYPPFYPPYGFMPPPYPQYPPYQSTLPPQPPPPPPPQQYQA